MSRFIDLGGQTFGRLTVSHRRRNDGRRTVWVCRCTCGRVVSVLAENLRAGRTTSCGCYKSEASAARKRTHGHSDTAEYMTWARAKHRCYNPRNAHYDRYGGRGIKMAEEWRRSFVTFLRDMGPRPRDCELDRIDNDGDYAPGNCRWTTRWIQTNNKGNTRYIEHAGQRMSASEWERHAGLSEGRLLQRLRAGWTIERALTAPTGQKRGPKPRH